MNTQKIEKALRAYNRNPRSAEAQEALREQLGGWGVIARDAGGKIDVEETLGNLTFAHEAGQRELEDCLTVAQLLEKPRERIPASPVDRRPLRKGKTVTKPVVDYSGIPEDLMVACSLAAVCGELPYQGERFPDERIAEDLKKTPPPAPWPRLLKDLTELRTKAEKGDKPAKRLLEQVEDRLWFDNEPLPVGEAVPKIPMQAPAEPCAAVRAGGGCPGFRGPCALPGAPGRCGKLVLARARI